MKVLIACEYSGTVRDAFAMLGHDAWSCDLLPTESAMTKEEGKHIQGDVLHILKYNWDMMIAHPPCTYFANAGLHYLKTRPERKKQLKEAYLFVLRLWNAPIKSIAIENPIGWLNTHWQKPTQIVQPYYFGTPELKTTCLWLKGLRALEYSDRLDRPSPKGFITRKTGRAAGKKYNYYWRQGKSAKERARFWPSIARAMANQWGGTNDEENQRVA